MLQTVGNICIGAGVLFVFIGLFGIYRFRDVYARILMAANIDTVGMLTILLGVMLKTVPSWFSLKVALILAISLLINPSVTGSIANSAYSSGHPMKGEGPDDD